MPNTIKNAEKMKPQELRIGNIVKSYHSDDPITVNGIRHDEDGYIGYFIEYEDGTVSLEIDEDFSPVEGIPLSEEWLLRFGFVDNCPWNFSFNMLNFAYDDEKRLHMAWGKGPFSVVGRGINYIHQLQNLYYALTGTELELKK